MLNMGQKIFIAVDIALLRKSKNLEVLLIKRKNSPFKTFWALPGGFVEAGERLIDAAKRELKEETGAKVSNLKQIWVFDDPKRDPRGRVISVLYSGFSNNHRLHPSSDAGKAEWFPINNFPKLAFDHKELIEKLKNKSKS